MDELTKEKLRNYGAAAIVLIMLLFSILYFVQYKEKAVIATKLNIVNSEFIQSLNASMFENRSPSEWGFRKGYKNMNLIESNFYNYFKIDTNCVHSPDKCMPKADYKSIKKKQTKVNLYKLPAVKLKNGVSVAVQVVGSCEKKREQCALIYVDINGPEEPNAMGKDMFVFSFVNAEKNFVFPFGDELDTKVLKKDKKYGCNPDSEMALYCAALIKHSGWKIRSDYPW